MVVIEVILVLPEGKEQHERERLRMVDMGITLTSEQHTGSTVEP